MKNKILLLIILILLGVGLYFIPHRAQAPQPEITNFETCLRAGGTVTNGVCTSPTGTCCFSQQPQATPEVIVDTPLPNSLITSPVTVKGRALGSWYFEANLPVILKDGNNVIIGQKGFRAITDWMTTGFVDFNDTLTFTMPTTQFGTLEIHNDNPSGDPINDKSFSVPVKFW